MERGIMRTSTQPMLMIFFRENFRQQRKSRKQIKKQQTECAISSEDLFVSLEKFNCLYSRVYFTLCPAISSTLVENNLF